jgi:hypothetical protein
VDANLDTLATALYVTVDDLLKRSSDLTPWRPAVGIAPKLSDAELLTPAVMQALLGLSPRRAGCDMPPSTCGSCLATCPASPATTKPLRWAAGLLRQVIQVVACDTTLWSDDVWVVDSTPVECGRSRETVKRSQLAGWATYGRCASHSRYWGLRLHLVCTPHGLPVAFALTGAKAVDREVLLDIFAVEPQLVAARPGQILLADKNYYGQQFERLLGELCLRLLRPARQGEPERAGAHLFKPLRQLIESVNQTFKANWDLERHRGPTPVGVAVRILQRILALTAVIWHNDKTGQQPLRSLVTYDH